MQNHIPNYDFNSGHNLYNGFEIIPISRIFEKSESTSIIPHKLNFHQILYIVEGEGVHTVDFNTINFKSNTIIPVSKGQVQQYDINTKNVKGYAILVTPEFVLSFGDNGYHYLYDFILFNHMIGQIAIDSDPLIKQHFDVLKNEEFSSNKFDNVEFICNTLKNLLILLERKKREDSAVACNKSLSIYQDFIKELEYNINYKIRVSDFCEKLNVTPKQLNASIKLITGTTAKDYIEERVILEAKRLLSYSYLSVKGVAYTIGFDDPTNFTKYFKKRTNQLPVNFRKHLS